ncbi:sulfotransferase domain-containing protein [Sphingopyxis indica]|uniref:Sulfotransferase domain-containing protein n=1 Tax=Sphingopyxis indica TaxID=436663 RepID=A0A239I6C3_9SPHN|nr:sulfotransferase domain-containing protein [Sphingopyxis indica]SNS88912.1 Sulfotransferase domain-containing protein [Sphingopyxis indica]
MSLQRNNGTDLELGFDPARPDWLPSFLVIGAVKSATTWVLEQLQANPAIYMPDPEPHYFSSEYHRGEDYYRGFFASEGAAGRLRGEKSADYLAHPKAPPRVAAMLHGARLVVQFRNPIERAYSDYKMLYRRGTIRGAPEEYLTSLDDNPHPRFLNDGLYAAHLRRWLDHFPEEQIHSFLFDDVRRRPQRVIEAISAHIGVAPVFDAGEPAKRANDSSERFLPLPVRRALSPLKTVVAPLRGTRWFEATRGVFASEIAYPPLSQPLWLRLRDFYADDVGALGKMLNRDLSSWLEDRDEARALADGPPPGYGLTSLDSSHL